MGLVVAIGIALCRVAHRDPRPAGLAQRGEDRWGRHPVRDRGGRGGGGHRPRRELARHPQAHLHGRAQRHARRRASCCSSSRSRSPRGSSPVRSPSFCVWAALSVATSLWEYDRWRREVARRAPVGVPARVDRRDRGSPSCARGSGSRWSARSAGRSRPRSSRSSSSGSSARSQAGWFSITWLVGSLCFMISPAVCQALLAEGSLRPEELDAKTRAAVGLSSGLLAVPLVVYVFFGSAVLRLFGPSYATQRHDAARDPRDLCDSRPRDQRRRRALPGPGPARGRGRRQRRHRRRRDRGDGLGAPRPRHRCGGVGMDRGPGGGLLRARDDRRRRSSRRHRRDEESSPREDPAPDRPVRPDDRRDRDPRALARPRTRAART